MVEALIKIILDSVMMVSMVMPRQNQMFATSMLLRSQWQRQGMAQMMEYQEEEVVFSSPDVSGLQRWHLGVGLVVSRSFGR